MIEMYEMSATSLKTYFSDKMGVYSPEDQTITWTADNGVRIVSYVTGRKLALTYPEYEKGNYLVKMIAIAKEALEQNGEGIFSQTLVRGIWPFNKTFNWHIFFDPHLTPIVTSFTRYPQTDDSNLTREFDPFSQDDLSTPYNSKLSREMMNKAGLILASFTLPPDSYAVIHKSIGEYFSLWSGHYGTWAQFADINFFTPWCKENSFIDGHASFSTVAWATVSKFILGVPEDEFVDYAHVWNTFLQNTKGLPQQAFTKFWYFPEMEGYVLKKIRDAMGEFGENSGACIDSKMPETIIYYWLRNKTAELLIGKLPETFREEALKAAKNRGITLEEMVYLDNFFSVMVGMQENIAFLLTQIVYHFTLNESIAKRCESSIKDCKKMVSEVLRFMPPAGISRELRWDSDVIDSIKGIKYSANKGDQFITMPAVTLHLDAFLSQHEVFDIDKPRIQSHAFSEGPHRCPGQITALHWLEALTHQLAKYQFCMEDKELEYYLSFIMRSDMKFKMSFG